MTLLTLRKLHKWVALVVGIQLFLWTLSGLMFALLKHEAVSGEHLTAKPQVPNLAAEAALTDPTAWIEADSARIVQEVSLSPLDGGWVYHIVRDTGIELRDAFDGTPVVINSARVRRLALDHYRGNGRLVGIQFLAEPTLETRQAGATWRATFDDAAGTSLYFSADDGALAATRTDAWRVFDFFWMLHTMDYAGRDDFNNPLVILVASASLWVALTGVLLLFRVFRRTNLPPRRASGDAEAT
jgi:uncharacterized iron-regulated membrane protein